MMHKIFFARVLLPVILPAFLAGCGSDDDGFSESLVEDRVSAIGVNGYLWRAALDTLSFMPMEDVDSAGGVIISDWYINPDVPTERLKVAVYILDQALRADGLKVSVFRQELADGIWSNANVRAATSMQIEEAILARARELRLKLIEED